MPVYPRNERRETRESTPAISYGPSCSPPVPFETSRIISELEEICFLSLSRKPRLQKLLRFLVHWSLANPVESLTERVIATSVLGRDESFDSRRSSLVRTQCSYLRAALVSHYSSHPAPVGPWICMPSGSYRIAFSQNPAVQRQHRPRRFDPGPAKKRVSRISILPVTTMPRNNDLGPAADALVLLQVMHFSRYEFSSPLPVTPTFLMGSDALQLFSDRTSSISVESSIVEEEDGIVISFAVVHGAKRYRLYESSATLPLRCVNDASLNDLDRAVKNFVTNCGVAIELLL